MRRPASCETITEHTVNFIDTPSSPMIITEESNKLLQVTVEEKLNQLHEFLQNPRVTAILLGHIDGVLHQLLL